MGSHLPSPGGHVMVGVALLLLVINLVEVIASSSSEDVFLLGNRQAAKDNVHYQLVHDEKNMVNSIEKAKEILRRYGYLRCGGTSSGYIKKKKHQGNGDGSALRASGGHNQVCSDESFRRALKQYQQTYNMIGTGALDTLTLKMMSESRCGNPDDDENIPPKPMFRTKRGKRLRRKLNQFNKSHRPHGKSRLRRESLEQWDTPHLRESITRRQKWLDQRIKDLSSGAEDQRLDAIHQRYLTTKKRRHRYKRSTADNTVSFPSEVVTWRLVGEATSEQLDYNDQRSALGLAFRMWGEVIPLVFHEDTKSPVDEVDILIAFGKGIHFNCQNNFDGYGGQLSHAVRAKTSAEIHVDDDEHLTIHGSDQGTNLVKVAVHEVGHALGLHHTSLNRSIMYAIYNKVYPYGNFELAVDDRRMIQAIYGLCKGRFDTVFDWVRPRYEGGDLIYNTYFFRDDKVWMYENKFGRPRYGDPLSISITEWKGLPDKIDACVHVWDPVLDARYFFKGRHYWKYDVKEQNVVPGYPRNISDDFGAIPGTKFPSIPNHLDSAFFDQRDGNVYFFKGNLVYAYDPRRGHRGCCLPGYPREISQEFPVSLTNEDGEEISQTKLPSNLDAVYYSYTDMGMYFFKGHTYYENVAFNPRDRRRINKLKGPKDVATKWRDICNVEL